MNEVTLKLPEAEAKALYRLIHQSAGGQDTFCEAYRQLQTQFFPTMTVEELTELLEGRP